MKRHRTAIPNGDLEAILPRPMRGRGPDVNEDSVSAEKRLTSRGFADTTSLSRQKKEQRTLFMFLEYIVSRVVLIILRTLVHGIIGGNPNKT